MGWIHQREETDAMVLMLTGRFTIQDAGDLKDALEEAHASEKKLIIDLSRIESLDLACVQIICNALLAYRERRQGLQVRGELPDWILRALPDILCRRFSYTTPWS